MDWEMEEEAAHSTEEAEERQQMETDGQAELPFDIHPEGM
jgi:hypothetical protein